MATNAIFDPGAGQPPEWQKLARAFGTAIPQHVMRLKPTVTYNLGHCRQFRLRLPDI
jgi:hypothetical protein